MIELKLPFPLSTNNLYFNKPGQGRIPTAEYRDWQEEAGWVLKSQRPAALTARALVYIDLDETRQGDADNRAKCVLDLLVKHGVLQGDSKRYVKRVSIGWEKVDGCRVAIEAAG